MNADKLKYIWMHYNYAFNYSKTLVSLYSSKTEKDKARH